MTEEKESLAQCRKRRRVANGEEHEAQHQLLVITLRLRSDDVRVLDLLVVA